MKNLYSYKKIPRLLFIVTFLLLTGKAGAQGLDFNSFFLVQAPTFYTPDSNNMIYPEVTTAEEMASQLDSIFPFTTREFYNAYPGISTDDTISLLPGLHAQLPSFDDKASEIKGRFVLNNKIDYWYAYYKKSTVDTTTAVLIFPGSGHGQSFLIANNEPNNYHNESCFIKDVALSYGDAYVIVKPNEDFRSIWKTIGDRYNKLDYDVLGPYTDFYGHNWAANLYIELLAQLKYLQSKYKRVLVMGLSNGGFPALVCGLEAGVDGINCASGMSVTSYTGFPVPNNENPYFSGLLNYYSLDTIKTLIRNSRSNVLFSYGNGDCCTNQYEYATHALENFINTPEQTCNAEFFYDFTGHTFPCEALPAFFTKTIGAPRAQVQVLQAGCTFDSLGVDIHLEGQGTFEFDLYKEDVLSRHITTTDASYRLTVTVPGKYEIRNLTDNTGFSVCYAGTFTYEPTLTPGAVLALNDGFLVATNSAYEYLWYKDDVLIAATTENRLPTAGSGTYYAKLNNGELCMYKTNNISIHYQGSLVVFPNPAIDNATLLLNEKFTGDWEYVIFDSKGSNVGRGRSRSASTTININYLSPGIYNIFARYSAEGGVISSKAVRMLKVK